MRAKIICSDDFNWYSDSIGKIFEVVPTEYGNYYHPVDEKGLIDKYRTIEKHHVVLLTSEEPINRKYKTHESICNKLNETYINKNKAYGDSFGMSFKEFGITAALVRLEDKWNRIKSLAKGAENNVHDESIKDTLLDMANYCIMTLIELEDNNET